jgi:membrane protease YdiL (CAAX protease family)
VDASFDEFVSTPANNYSGGPFERIASPAHTVAILCLQGALAILSKMRLDHVRDAVTFDRVRIYERTIFFEWLVLALVVVGVRLHRSSLNTIFGERWRSLRQVFNDMGIALIFLVASIAVLSIFSAHSKAPDSATQFLLPQGRLESALWIAMSLSAGICEEAVFRGYLQRQFVALTKSAALGIALSAAAFGAAHAYQGVGHAMKIGLLGGMLGVLAWWRKSVRPGMISHAAQDILAILVRH